VKSYKKNSTKVHHGIIMSFWTSFTLGLLNITYDITLLFAREANFKPHEHNHYALKSFSLGFAIECKY